MSLLHTWDSSTEVAIREWSQATPTYKPPTALADVVSAFFRNRKAIVIALLVFVFSVTAVLVLANKIYESHLTYIVRGEGAALPTTSFDGQGSAMELASQLTTETQIGTEAELLSNMELHRKVLARLQPKATAAQIDKQLLGFGKHLKILPIPKTTLIAVSYMGTSRENALATLAALNQEYLATRATIRGSEKAFDFFDSEANRYYRQLQMDQKSLANFESENQVTLLEEEKDLATHRLSETQGQLNEVESARAESSRKLAKMAAEHETLPGRIETQKRELPDQIGEGHLNSLLIDLQNKRQELLTKYHESDRHVQEVDEQILNTRHGLEALRSARSTEVLSDVNPIRASVDSDLEHLKIQTVGFDARRKTLQSQAAAYEAELQRLDRITAQHDDLMRSIKQNEGNYELYSKRREEARIDKTLDGSKIANVALIAGPAINPEAFGPRVLGIASVYLIGCILIAGIGVVAGLWSPRFHAPWEIETAASTPVLATVPFVKALSARTSHPHTISGTSGLNEDSRVKENDPLVHLALHQNGRWIHGSAGKYLPAPQSSASDGTFAALIERLRRISSSRPGGLAFALTSSTPGEGVSHVVQGLSEELQRYTGKRVAVVTAPDRGVSSFASMLSRPGGIDSGFAESGEESLRNWFRLLRETNDYVLVDCPSLAKSHCAITLGRESDGVLMVVGAGDATRIQLRGSMAALSLASIPLVGIAMNKRRYPIPSFIYRTL